MGPIPPQRALKFLRWFCREDYIEEIEGDLTEVFEKHYSDSPSKANRIFAWNVIRYFRPAFIKSFKRNYNQNHTAMFRHNFLLTYRSFKRYKTSFFINLIGLSTGLACALLIYLWVNDELYIDKFHEKDSRLYQVMENQHNTDGIMTSEATPGLLAETMAEETPEVEYAVPTSWSYTNTLSLEERNVAAKAMYAGKDFFNMFSYPLIRGDKDQVLTDKNSMVISESLAKRLFNTTENIVGKAVEVQHDREFLISGIFKDVPDNSSIQFDFVLSFEVYKDDSPWVLDWTNNGILSYLVLRQGTNIDQFNEKIADYVKNHGGEQHITLMAVPYSNQYLYGKYENGKQVGVRIAYVRLFSIIAIFILSIACINFMNLSTARASRRFKEIGIKKAIGAHRNSLIFQFLGESLLITCFSLFVALVIVMLLLPQFNQITGKHLSLEMSTQLSLAILCIVVVTGLLAGSYPALYLSKFKPVSILKVGVLSGRSNKVFGPLWARKGLVVFQFTLSIILIVSVLVVYKQIDYTQTKNLGYNKDNIVHFELEGKAEKNMDTFLSQIENLPGVVSASTIGHSLVEGGYRSSSSTVQWAGKNPDDIVEMECVRVNYDMIETLGIRLKEGRRFSRDFGADSTKIIFNEAAIQTMGLKDPVGKVIQLWGSDREIIGVTKDFHFQSFHEKVNPLFFILKPNQAWIVMARVAAGREKEVISGMEKLYQQFNPGFAFNYRFLDEDYQAQYAAEQRVSVLSRYFAGIAILISCLGLFGLATFNSERRLKEIGIRKILGATDFGIVRLLSTEFTRIVLMAIVIALPVSYFIARNWLESFAYRIDLQWWFFIGAGLIAFSIAWFTVGLQTVKAARVNPTQCLKDE
jgi:ABC-type antimicrobial peptide transport system permease subunit